MHKWHSKITLTRSPTCNLFHGIGSHLWPTRTSTGVLFMDISFWKRFCCMWKDGKKKCQVCSREFLVNVDFSYNFSSASTHPILKCLFNKGNKEHNTKGDHIRHWVHRTAYQTIKGNEFLLIDKRNIMIISCHKSWKS